MTFRLYQGANETLRKMVETGDADICLSSPPLPSELLQWTVLEKEPLYAVLPENHPLAGNKSIQMKEMQDEDFVGFKPGYGLRYMFDLMCRDLNIHPHLAFEGEEVSTILADRRGSWGCSAAENRGAFILSGRFSPGCRLPMRTHHSVSAVKTMLSRC